MKKNFKETKIGKFLTEKGSGIMDIVDDFIPPLKVVTNLIDRDERLTPEEREAAKILAIQTYEIEVKDRDSARNREIEIAKSGKKDVLQLSAGFTALVTFILMVIAVVFGFAGTEKAIFHQLMGIIEGVALTVFAYYFGTSKSSSEKTKSLESILKK
jgi:hypothetical protein